MLDKCSRRRHPSILVRAFGISVYLWFISQITLAQNNSTNGDTAAFDEDARPKAGYQITPKTAVGAQLEIKLRDEVGFESADEHIRSIEPKLKTSLYYMPQARISAFLELDAKRKFDVSTIGRGSDPEWQVNVKRAYITLNQFIGVYVTTLGRQVIEDERAWLIKDELDGGVLFWEKGQFEFGITAAKKAHFRRNLLEANGGKGETVYLLEANYRFVNTRRPVGAYFLDLSDAAEGREDLSFVGFRSTGDLNARANYWLDVARVRGNRRDVDIRGYGVDVGGTYTFDFAGKPSVTAGLAFGSGDNSSDDDVDHAFRQTGLQKNNSRFSGLPKVRYYGAALDPELSNLLVGTAALGIRPTAHSSVELIYHHYWQHKATDHLRDVSIRRKPDGVNKELGSGLDIIFGVIFLKDWLLEGVAAAFFSGDSFDSAIEPAYFIEFKLKYLL